MDAKSTREDIDSYMFSSAFPFINCFLRNAIKDIQIDVCAACARLGADVFFFLQDDKLMGQVEEFSKLLESLMASIVDFIVKRHEVGANYRETQDTLLT